MARNQSMPMLFHVSLFFVEGRVPHERGESKIIGYNALFSLLLCGSSKCLAASAGIRNGWQGIPRFSARHFRDGRQGVP